MPEMNFFEFNPPVINAFRANAGKLEGALGDLPILLITTMGAKSGQPRTSPLDYLCDNGRLFVFATAAGSTKTPNWYYNVVAHPQVTVEFGAEKFEATAVTIGGETGRQLYARMVQLLPRFADYARKANREIPVVELIRLNRE